MIKLTDILLELLLEKKADRCLRIARQKYDKPSAYRSGAIVRCRRGEIWKDIKEITAATELAIQKIDELPKGKIFDDAKNIERVFTKSQHSWSEVVELFEKNKHKAKLQDIDIRDIHITQPNIQSNKVKQIIRNLDKTPTINVVEFENGEKALYDGHHRLVANWALGNTKIRVNLIQTAAKSLEEDESLHKWFNRQGAPGKSKGWVDCNTCREVNGKMKCRACGRQKGEERAKYPSCRPTPSACKQSGKGKKWGKTK